MGSHLPACQELPLDGTRSIQDATREDLSGGASTRRASCNYFRHTLKYGSLRGSTGFGPVTKEQLVARHGGCRSGGGECYDAIMRMHHSLGKQDTNTQYSKGEMGKCYM